MTVQEVKALLPTLAEPAYQRFNAGLIPGVSNLLGVRMPALRRVAKDIARGDWRAYLRDADQVTYEEAMLQGLVIGYAKAGLSELLPYVQAYVETLDNWSTCDSFCTSFKAAKAEPERIWAFIQPYFGRQEPYAIRFAVVMALMYFLDDAHLDAVLGSLDAIRHEDYYVKMAVAWAVSMAYVQSPARVQAYLEACALDDWTYNKALQKVIESRQVGDDTRAQMRAMKRKGVKQGAQG